MVGLFSLGWMGGISASDQDPAPRPTFLVEPYLQLPTPTGMTVMWETSHRLPGQVEYGLTPELGQVARAPTESNLHEVRLTGLKAGTPYYYRVRSGGLFSGVFRFKTAPPPGTKRWRMALYGDSRSFPATHRKVAAQIAAADVDLIVHTGDIVTDGRDHESWRTQFFEPLGSVARSVPWVSTIGNHERDSANYFSYVALPGNERYFGLDFANAHIVCLDSNGWIEKGRDSEQGRWLADDLARPRGTTWTFVAFHHPLFSAHATRPINSLRWDWAPVFLDPANRVDAVLTGHDHFYARNWRMGRVADKPTPGIQFITSAGGGAPLYKTTDRDYLARHRSVHHFTLLEFDGDRIVGTPIDVTGKAFDRFVLTREPTPPEEFCAYEVEELRRFLRMALASAAPVRVNDVEPSAIDTVLSVPTRFAVPVTGRLVWHEAPGWKLRQTTVDFQLAPGQALKIPLQAEVTAGPFDRNPSLTITFDPGKFRNRTIDLYPFQLTGPERISANLVEKGPVVDGKLDDPAWQGIEGTALLGLPFPGGRADRVRFALDRDWLYLGAGLDDPTGRVQITPPGDDAEGSRVVLAQEHVGLILSDGKTSHVFALAPDHVRYYDGPEEGVVWKAAAARGKGTWSVEMAIPRSLFADWSRVRVNVTHRRQVEREFRDFHLCPTYTFGTDPDRITDTRPTVASERHPRLILK
jgi:3',5'-cyclic AMP phosphodiesterase CpdA